MNNPSTAFDYDDFELYLLEAAKVDHAPEDLPARLGVALSLGVPVLVATEAASLMPTATSLSVGSAPGVGTSALTKGIFAALKASLGVGATTLWNTAAKGIAVGLLAGGAVLGTSQGVIRVAAMASPHEPSPIAVVSAPHHATTQDATSNLVASEATPPAPKPESATDSPLANGSEFSDTGRASGKNGSNQRVYTGPSSESYPLGPLPAVDNEKPRVRLPRRIIPDKTNAIARYPLLYDDVSAFYDTPKKAPTIAPATPPAAAEPMIDPTELATMRSKTLQRCRTLLGQSKAAQALSELDNFRTRVGERNFGVEELLLHIEALAAMGRAKEAQADVAQVGRLAPNSPALRQAQLLAGARFVR